MKTKLFTSIITLIIMSLIFFALTSCKNNDNEIKNQNSEKQTSTNIGLDDAIKVSVPKSAEIMEEVTSEDGKTITDRIYSFKSGASIWLVMINENFDNYIKEESGLKKTTFGNNTFYENTEIGEEFKDNTRLIYVGKSKRDFVVQCECVSSHGAFTDAEKEEIEEFISKIQIK